MWNLTPDYIQQVKEELKGRRAAIQARHADELKALEGDIEELEMLERVAYAIAVKHLAEPAEPVQAAQAEAAADEVAELQPASAGLVTVDPEPDGKGLSRWRRRLETPSGIESA